MRIVGLDNFSRAELDAELQAGARLVIFQYCVSAIVMTFREGSNVHILRPNDRPYLKSLPFSLCSLILGWWGIPWGPIRTISTVVRNCQGGIDVTTEILRKLDSQAHPPNLDELRARLQYPDSTAREQAASRL